MNATTLFIFIIVSSHYKYTAWDVHKMFVNNVAATTKMKLYLKRHWARNVLLSPKLKGKTIWQNISKDKSYNGISNNIFSLKHNKPLLQYVMSMWSQLFSHLEKSAHHCHSGILQVYLPILRGCTTAQMQSSTKVGLLTFLTTKAFLNRVIHNQSPTPPAATATTAATHPTKRGKKGEKLASVF